MVPINLPNGKTVFITPKEYANEYLEDPETYLQNLIAKDEGYHFDDPFDTKIDNIRDNATWEVPDVPNDLPKSEIENIKKEVKKD